MNWLELGQPPKARAKDIYIKRENDKGKWTKYNMQMRNIHTHIYIYRGNLSPLLLIKRTIGPVLHGEKPKPFRFFSYPKRIDFDTGNKRESHHALNIRADRTRI